MGLPLELVVRLAQREAAALTLVPDLEVRTEFPAPMVLFDVRQCPCCAGRKAPSLRGGAGEKALPELSILTCEEIEARSLLPLRLIRTTTDLPRFSTRAVFWAEFTGPAVLSPAQILQGLRVLDERERWLDDMPAGRLPHPAADRPVLPVSARNANLGGSGRGIDEVAASRRSLHFLTPHVNHDLLRELNEVYLAARLTAVREALGSSTQPVHAL